MWEGLRESLLADVKRVLREQEELTTFFPLWGGMNLGWMKEQPLARASNGPGPGGREGHVTCNRQSHRTMEPGSSPAVLVGWNCIVLYGG